MTKAKTTKIKVQFIKQDRETSCRKIKEVNGIKTGEPITVQEAKDLINKFEMKLEDKEFDGLETIYTYA